MREIGNNQYIYVDVAIDNQNASFFAKCGYDHLLDETGEMLINNGKTKKVRV
jgi:hypothetical protein